MQTKKILDEIYTTKNFKRLDSFENSKTWCNLSENERELLAKIFVMQGEKQLLEGNSKFKESFQRAEKISSNSPDILYQQARILAKQKDSVSCLKAAVKIFNRILALNPTFFEVWHGLSISLTQLGKIEQSAKILQEAVAAFTKAEKLINNASSTKHALFYHHFAVLWYYLGKESGEACDFKYSIQKFKLAEEHGLNTHDFWNDYGNSLFELSILINKREIFSESIGCYSKVVKIEPKFYQGWMNLGVCLQSCCYMDSSEKLFNLTCEIFKEAANLKPELALPWIEWGRTLFLRGKIFKDRENLSESLEKFEVGGLIEPNNSSLLTLWGEACLLLGVWLDDLSFFKKAQEKLKKSIEIQKDSPESWSQYGNCLNELGRYFHEADYHVQAIEIFKRGLKISPKNLAMLYGLAISYFALGLLNRDIGYLEKSSHYFKRVIDNGGYINPQYWNDWGLVLVKLTDIADEKRYILQAIAKFEEAITISGNLPDKGISSEYLFNWGLALDNLGDFEDDPVYYQKAYLAFEKVLEVSPNYPNIHHYLAISYAHYAEMTDEMEYYNKAMEHMEICLRKDPENDIALCDWGEILINLAELVYDPTHPRVSEKFFCEAEDKLMRSTALGNSFALYYLACVYSLSGNFSSSMFYLEKAFQQIPEPEFSDILQDEWLDSLRDTNDFQEFIKRVFNDHS